MHSKETKYFHREMKLEIQRWAKRHGIKAEDYYVDNDTEEGFELYFDNLTFGFKYKELKRHFDVIFDSTGYGYRLINKGIKPKYALVSPRYLKVFQRSKSKLVDNDIKKEGFFSGIVMGLKLMMRRGRKK